MAVSDMMEIRLAGKDISPDKVRAGEISEIIAAVENMIASIVSAKHPQITKEDIIVGIINIKDKSVGLQFSSQLPELTWPAFSIIASSVATGEFSSLPSGSIKALQQISAFTRRKQCVAELISHTGDSRLLATIGPDTKIDDVPLIKGETVIYGQLIRIGGRTPRAMIETVDGQTIYCEIEKGLATSLGEKLYSQVGLQGIAKWNAKTLSLEEFFIANLTDYQDKKVYQATQDLSRVIGKYFSAIKDVNKYVSRLREDGEEA